MPRWPLPTLWRPPLRLPKLASNLSICITDPKKPSPRLYRMDAPSTTGSNLGTYSIKEHEKESRSSHETSSDGPSSQQGHTSVPSRTPVFGEDNVALTPAMGKDALKRKKPKTNLVKSNSQFISRVIPHDNLAKRLQDHDPEGIFIFANIDRAYQWLDMSSPVAAKPGLIDYHLERRSSPFEIRAGTTIDENSICASTHAVSRYKFLYKGSEPYRCNYGCLQPVISCGLKLSLKSTFELIKVYVISISRAFLWEMA